MARDDAGLGNGVGSEIETSQGPACLASKAGNPLESEQPTRSLSFPQMVPNSTEQRALLPSPPRPGSADGVSSRWGEGVAHAGEPSRGATSSPFRVPLLPTASPLPPQLILQDTLLITGTALPAEGSPRLRQVNRGTGWGGRGPGAVGSPPAAATSPAARPPAAGVLPLTSTVGGTCMGSYVCIRGNTWACADHMSLHELA